jgi:hypothetical protein
MNSLDEECTPLKTKYDECFNVWFRDSFLKGKAEIGHDQACGELFKSYQSCVQVSNGAIKGGNIACFHSGFIVLQKAFEKHKIPQKEVYMDILGTDREKIPTPPKPKSRT